MTPEQLKASILQLAIQGKLVEQRPEDGTAEELYQKIQEEKQSLLKVDKIKKEKPLAEISEDEIPFDIPDNWKWVYLGEIFMHNTGKAQNSSDNKNGEKRKFITTSNLYWGKFNFDKVKEMKFTEKELERCTVKKGDLLVCEGGDCGRSAIWNFDEEVCIQNHVHRLRAYTELSIEYFYYIMYLYKSTGRLRGRGVAIQGLSTEAIHKVIVPLPPLAEQQRIVEKIEQLEPFVDRYAKSWEKLEKFNNAFPEDMKKSILQYAMQGKLVEQRPEDGTAEELYQQIQQEKQALLKEGKIKKEKPLADISEEEKPFDIPDTWKWVRFAEVASFFNGDRGKNYPNKNEYVDKGIAWINTGHITSNGYLDKNLMNYITEEKFASLSNGHIQENDLVYCLRGATFGKVARIEPFNEGAVASSLMIIRLIEKEMREYIFHFLKSPVAYNELHKYDNGSAQPNLAAKDVAKYLIPLPPLAEQKRIVAKIEEILPMCERLKK